MFTSYLLLATPYLLLTTPPSGGARSLAECLSPGVSPGVHKARPVVDAGSHRYFLLYITFLHIFLQPKVRPVGDNHSFPKSLIFPGYKIQSR